MKTNIAIAHYDGFHEGGSGVTSLKVPRASEQGKSNVEWLGKLKKSFPGMLGFERAFLSLLICFVVFWHPTARAQLAPIPLSGGPLVKMTADYQRPYIYAIQSPASGATNGNLLFVNTTNNSIDKTLVIGTNPTDLTINVAENKLYVIDHSNNAIYRVDLSTQTLLSPFNFGANLTTISGENATRLIVVGLGQYTPYYDFVNTASGTLVYTPGYYPFSDGDGEVDSAGAYYYFGTAGSWPPVIGKWQIQGDYLGQVATISVQQQQYVNGTGTHNLILSHDNARLFYNGNIYDTNLNQLAYLGSEVFACSSNGAVIFSSTQVFDGTSWLPMYTLPVATTVSAVDGNDNSFWYYSSISNTIESLPLSLMQNPVILQQPTNQTVMSGNTAVIGVLASGRSPLFYNWYCNGTNIAFTTTNQISISNFQAANAGYYTVIITNIYGSTSSSNATVTVSYIPPSFTSQPSSLVVPAGSNASLSVSAIGSLPIGYQWRLNGVSINGETNPILNFTNLQITDQGNYDVVAVNGFGSTNSSVGYLNVVDLAEALNTTDIVWGTSGDVPWQVQFRTTHDGIAAAQSGVITIGQQSLLQTTVTGPGTLTYWWNEDSDNTYGCDFLIFLVNGAEQMRISFLTGWLPQTVYIGAGSQVLQWDYTNALGCADASAGWVDQVNFTPGGTPPLITLYPTNQVVLLGSNATVNATAQGTPPLSYQWQLNLTNLDGATNASLALPSVQFTNEGNYTLVVSNEYGVTNTTAVFVNVVDFTESLNATNLIWSSGGNQPWFPETSTTHDGIAALQSGAITGNQQSTVQTTVSGPGTLSFWWMISSETNNDYVNFSADGVEQNRISGTVNWQQYIYSVATGTHTFTWNYSKNATINKGSDAAWLDQVSYAPGATAPVITTNPTNQMAQSGQGVSFLVIAYGTPSLYYQWQFNGTNINNATNATLTLTNLTWPNNGAYTVIISNIYGTVISSNAILTLPRSLVVAWGNNSWGQTNVPSTLTNAIGIAAGYENSLAVKTDGTVSGWGYNGWQETAPPTGLNNVVAIATGSGNNSPFSLALKTDGTVYGWGNNGYKQTSAPSGLSNVVAIAAGQYHSLALRNDGKVFAWGNNSYGQTNVPVTLTNATAIAAGYNFCLALLSSGSVVAWGDNTYGQTNVPSGLTNVIAIASGWYHCLALKNDGTITAWGNNNYHQTNVPAGLSNVIAIGAGQYHSLAVKNDGTVVAWGGTYTQTNVPSGLNHVVAVAGGADHSLALLNDGPPSFYLQPLNQTNYAGMATVFSGKGLGLNPLSYQWQFNGTNINGATNTLLTFTNLQPVNAGIYNLIISNSFGMMVSSNANLTVIAIAPTIALQPTNRTASAGSNVTFTVAAGPGPVPITYQWQFIGTNIVWATNASLTLTNVQPPNQGIYDVVVSNNFGFITSSNAFLVVTGLPPKIVSIQPTNQTMAFGSNYTFTATATGSPPLSYQWQFGGTNMDSATNASLALSNVQSTNEGIYTVVVTNYFGLVTSNVLLMSFPTALNSSGLIWTSSGYAAWFPESTVTHDSVATAQSGSFLGSSRHSILQTTVVGPGTLSYWWNISSGGAFLDFSINGINQAEIFSTTGWRQQTYYLGEGMQTLAWNYTGGLYVSGANAAWLDQVSFVPGGTAPIITNAPTTCFVRANTNTSFTVGAVGTPPLVYQWQFNGTNLVNQTNATLPLLNVQPTNSGTYSVVITNNYGSISTNAALFVQQFTIKSGSTNLLMTTNGFQLLLNGILTTNPVVILGSTDLVVWLPIYTNPATTGSIQYLDFTATNLPARFYKAQE